MSFATRFWAAWLDVALPSGDWVAPLRPSVMATIDLNLKAFPPQTRRLLGLGMRVYDLAACVRHGRPFLHLTGPQRRAFAGWATHGLLGVFAQGASRIVLFAFYQEPEVCRRLGYAPTSRIKEGAHDRSNLGA